jgi:hypothetical protein
MESNRLIKFHHPSQDLTKVCTLVDIFYNGNSIEDKWFFLEKQDIKNNTFCLDIPEEKYSVKIRIKKENPDYDLEKMCIEII